MSKQSFWSLNVLGIITVVPKCIEMANTSLVAMLMMSALYNYWMVLLVKENWGMVVELYLELNCVSYSH
jgi:hypothetical protein